MKVSTAVSPLPSASYPPLGSKLNPPLAFTVNNPDPKAMGAPTEPGAPLTAVTVNASPSGSLSGVVGLAANTSPVRIMSSFRLKTSFTATGQSLFPVRVMTAAAPEPSDAHDPWLSAIS